jgi:YegS/Rv2252/BmrU family lipid kinase
MNDGRKRHGGVVHPWHPCNAWSNSPLKTCFILNPRSGRAARTLPAIQAFAARHRASLVLTERSRHASELAQRALVDGCELIVAVGGDGTMNEVASTLVGTAATLGLVPCGSGDGLGRHLGIHGSPEHALDILLRGRPRLIDSGLADGHPFFTAAGIGFEAEIAQRFNALARRGFARYLTTSARAFREWTAQDCSVEHDGRRDAFRAFTLAVTNANQYGNDARICPDALLDDGQLDLCVVPPIGLWNALPLARHLFRGTIGRAPNVILRRSHRFIVERPAPGLLHTDGELHQAGTRIEFVVRPASLRVMCPPQT